MKQLIEVYNDTKKLSEKISPGETIKYTFDDIIDVSGSMNPNVEVLPLDTINTALQIKGKNSILNMASHKRPGGGVRNGKIAQEECLFRSTNLTDCIPKSFYPLSEDVCLYTKDATILKDGIYFLLNKYVKADFITLPAINLNGKSKPENYEELIENKIRLIFISAYYNNCDNLILGSWGCGVFKNNPVFIANSFKKIIEEKGSLFKNIIFGIINDRNSVSNNYEIFKKILK
jgi:uncharacterized protein (TIGR02452 family)